MIRSRLGLKVLGLCAVLVGMFAFTGAAQASTGALWKIGGAQAKGGEAVEAESEAAGGILLTELGGKFIHVKCLKLKLVGAKLVEPNGKITGKIDFSECDFLSLTTQGGSVVLQKACEPFVGTNKGLIETNTINGLIVLHTPTGGKAEGVLEAKGEPDFATINLGPECSVGEKLLVEGVFFLKDCEGKFSTENKTHLVEELKALTKLTLNGGTKTATIDGSALATLATGSLWAGIPN